MWSRCLLLLLAACSTPPPSGVRDRPVHPGDPLPRRGDEIVACGRLFHTGTPVVLWTDPGGYDAYRVEKRFEEPAEAASGDGEEVEGARYGTMRRNLPPALEGRVRERGWTLDDLREVVHLFVVHYDMAGTARQCFKVLHDRRGLSVHFLLDVDGTIYQTLDLKERAWHATVANDHGIGIEIAHPGAYPQPGHPAMRRWYEEDGQGLHMRFPPWIGEPGVRTPGFVSRPARPGLFEGTIHGRRYYQHDFTDEQYRALAHLVAALSRVFPRIDLTYPGRREGGVDTGHLDRERLHGFEGLVGHWHVQTNKQDPGPAFDWQRLVREARALLPGRGGGEWTVP